MYRRSGRASSATTSSPALTGWPSTAPTRLTGDRGPTHSRNASIVLHDAQKTITSPYQRKKERNIPPPPKEKNNVLGEKKKKKRHHDEKKTIITRGASLQITYTAALEYWGPF